MSFQNLEYNDLLSNSLLDKEPSEPSAQRKFAHLHRLSNVPRSFNQSLDNTVESIVLIKNVIEDLKVKT